MSGVEGGKGTCYQWKEKGQCSKGTSAVSVMKSNDRAQQKPSPNAATLSDPVEEKKYQGQEVILLSFFDIHADAV